MVELLRAPSGLRESRGGGDLDILVPPGQLESLSQWLKKHDFREDYSPESYRHVWRLRRPEQPTPFTVDIYTHQRWGAGVELADHIDATDRRVRFLRALFDKSNRNYFSDVYPENAPSELFPEMCPAALADWLWKTPSWRLVGGLLVSSGVIQIEAKSFLQSLGARVSFRTHQLVGKRGLEVVLAGVDGAGKTTLSKDLVERLPMGTVRMYMGNSDFVTPMMRWVDRADRDFGYLRFLLSHLDNMIRRFIGLFQSKRGYVVIYDRHPAERTRSDAGWKSWLNNLVTGTYAWGFDQTFLLTGSLEEFHRRKPEHSVRKLRDLRANLRWSLAKSGIEVREIDTVEHSAEEVYTQVAREILAHFRDT